MSFLVRQLNMIIRPLSFINNLSYALRSLSLTPKQNQQQSKLLNENIKQQITATSKEEEKECHKVFEKVKEHLVKEEGGRLFAVIHLCGKQFKVTAGDIILVEGYWPPTIGDEIRLEKVLLAGARDFTLIGRPLLEPGLVDVRGTIIEKTLAHTKIHFKKKRRKQYMRTNFQRSPNTMIRINTINVDRDIDYSGSNITNEKQIF